MTLASSGLTIDDLAGKTIIAFQNARSFLPDPCRATVATSPVYTEVPNQHLQNLGLLRGNFQVVIADINIFNWFMDDFSVTAAAYANQTIAYHEIFPPTPYHVAFQGAAIRDAFGAALTAMKDDGRYDAIIAEYGGVQ